MASIFGKLVRKKDEDVIDAQVLDTKKTEEKSHSDEIVKPETSEEKKSAGSETSSKTSDNGHAYRVLIKPYISEKAAYAEESRTYTFVVARNASKVEIKKAISDVYGITPKKVHVIHMDGKKVRFGARTGRRKDWKKAIVTLPKGKTIDVHAGV